MPPNRPTIIIVTGNIEARRAGENSLLSRISALRHRAYYYLRNASQPVPARPNEEEQRRAQERFEALQRLWFGYAPQSLPLGSNEETAERHVLERKKIEAADEAAKRCRPSASEALATEWWPTVEAYLQKPTDLPKPVVRCPICVDGIAIRNVQAAGRHAHAYQLPLTSST